MSYTATECVRPDVDMNSVPGRAIDALLSAAFAARDLEMVRGGGMKFDVSDAAAGLIPETQVANQVAVRTADGAQPDFA